MSGKRFKEFITALVIVAVVTLWFGSSIVGTLFFVTAAFTGHPLAFIGVPFTVGLGLALPAILDIHSLDDEEGPYGYPRG